MKTEDLLKLGTNKCLVCYRNTGKIRNDTIYFHVDPDTKNIWCWCNRCERGYSIFEYCKLGGISLKEFLKQDFTFKESPRNEVNKIAWPKSFVPLADKRADRGIEYIRSRGLEPDDNMFYDTWREGIVFPYYFDTVFCGAQIRLVEPWINEDGDVRKVDTLPGTRLGLLFYNWDQNPLDARIKGVIICEGAFNALSIQQALNEVYGGFLDNPWKCVACSGSGGSEHHRSQIKELKDSGIKTVIAPDSDKAGMKMLRKFSEYGAITHYVLTGDDNVDWNDAVGAYGKVDFARWFMKSIKSV